MKVNWPLILFFLFQTLVIYASPPIPFSGKLSVNNQNFEGTAEFAFSIIDENGTELWRHAQDPDQTIQNQVSKGRYLVLLGGQGMEPIPANLFLAHDHLFLRVSVDLLDGQGSRILYPDKAITSSPYALSAELARLAERATIAEGVIDGAISLTMLSPDILADLNRTILHSNLSADILADLNRTIERSSLASDILADLNRTIFHSDLSAEILTELGRTINLSDLSAAVIEELNDTVGIGSIGHEQLSEGILADLNRTIERSQLASDILDDLNRTITLSMLGQDVLDEINSSSLTVGSVTSGFLDPNLTRYFLPEIVSSPASISVLQGTSASLSGQADGKFISYQWQRNGQPIEGATEATLSLQDLNASLDDGNYTLVVSNDWGSVTTQPATLAIATALPTISITGSSNLTHEAATEYTDAGASANDALGNDLNDSLVVTGVDFNVSSVGEYTVTYTVTDAGGNQNSITRTVTIVDTTSPTISLTGGTSYSHGTGTTWVDPGYEASDTVDGNLTASVTVSGNVDINTNGTYSLVYSVSDAAGNEANVTRSVSVQPMGPWTFTNAGATGRLGPTQAQVNSAYTNTSLDSAVTINTQGIQEWIVPASGTYSIEVWGAEGGSGFTTHGLGAKIFGKFTLSSLQILNVLIGQKGGDYATDGGGGGGGSFVWLKNSQSPMIIAGGGGGASDTNSMPISAYIHGQASNPQYYTQIGYGGNYGSSTSWAGGGGGGWHSDGATQSSYGVGGKGVLSSNGLGANSAETVSSYTDGGFGGGGSNGYDAGGGGGGYTGGNGGAYSNTLPHASGGGSYNSGTEQINQSGVVTGHGKVVITFISN